MLHCYVSGVIFCAQKHYRVLDGKCVTQWCHSIVYIIIFERTVYMLYSVLSNPSAHVPTDLSCNAVLCINIYMSFGVTIDCI